MFRSALMRARSMLIHRTLLPPINLRPRLAYSTSSDRSSFPSPLAVTSVQWNYRRLEVPRNPQEVFVADDWHEPPLPYPSRLPLNTVVQAHPLISIADMVEINKNFAPRHIEEGGFWGDENAWGFKAIDEFATKPACRKLRIEVAHHVFPIIKDPKGVTVRQVYKTMARHWAKRALIEVDTEEQLREVLGPYKITNRTMLLDHNGWTDWETKEVRMDGSILLKATHLDS